MGGSWDEVKVSKIQFVEMKMRYLKCQLFLTLLQPLSKPLTFLKITFRINTINFSFSLSKWYKILYVFSIKLNEKVTFMVVVVKQVEYEIKLVSKT